jgi:outer membrane protein TolC
LGTNKQSAETAYAADEGTLADPLRAAVDMGDVEGRLATVEQDRLDSLANLAALMARPLDPSTRVASPPKFGHVASLGTLSERAKMVSPDIQETEHLIRSQQAWVSHAKSQYGPDLTLRWGYDDRYNQQDAWTGRVMISVPLWSFSKQRFGVRESKAMLKRAKSMNEERVLSVEADVKAAHARYRAATKRIDIYARKVVPRARTYLRATKENYRAGNGDFDEVIDSVLALRKAEIELIRARTDQQRAYADLERAVGSSPAREGS